MPPRLPLHDAEPAPPTLMYWSRAPVWGTWGALPAHKMRSHSATVVDNSSIWLFGGCDDKEFWRDVMCLDVGEFYNLFLKNRLPFLGEEEEGAKSLSR